MTRVVATPLALPPFVPANHYWIVGGDKSRLWSSEGANYVSADDAAYAEWLASGWQPTPIANEFELDLVLRKHGMSVGRTFAADEARTALMLIDSAKMKAALGRDDIREPREGEADKLAALAAELQPASAAPPIDGSVLRKGIAEALADLAARFEAREAELIAKGVLARA
jgi:hypothetical protein